MATAKKKTGRVEEPVEPQEPTSEPGQEPESTFQPPEEYKDKSLEDVIKIAEEAKKMHKEVEKKFGSLGDELGKERKERERAQADLNYLQTYYQTQQKPQEEPQETSAVNFDYDNPAQSVDQIVEKRLNSWAEEQKKRQQQQEYQEASQNFYRGRAISLQGNKDLYEGIEREVDAVVWNAYANKAISKLELSDPTTWEDAAWIIHKKRKNWDKLVPPKVKPVSPTPTETPTEVKPGVSKEEIPNIELDDLGKEFMAHRPEGMSEKDFLKQVQETRKKSGRSR